MFKIHVPRFPLFAILITTLVAFLLANLEVQVQFSRKPGVSSDLLKDASEESQKTIMVGYDTECTIDIHPTRPHQVYPLFDKSTGDGQ